MQIILLPTLHYSILLSTTSIHIYPITYDYFINIAVYAIGYATVNVYVSSTLLLIVAMYATLSNYAINFCIRF